MFGKSILLFKRYYYYFDVLIPIQYEDQAMQYSRFSRWLGRSIIECPFFDPFFEQKDNAGHREKYEISNSVPCRKTDQKSN